MRAAAAALAFFAAACSGENGPTEPSMAPSFSATDPQPGELILCKYTDEPTAAEFDFRVSASGGAVPGDGSFTLHSTQDFAPGPECVVAWTATGPDAAIVSIEEIVDPGWHLRAVFFGDLGFVEPLENPVELTVTSAGGFVVFKNDPVEVPPCAECQGGVTELTLRNNGPSGEVVVKAGKKEIFRSFVASGETFTVHGMKKDGTLGKEIKIRVDGGPETKIHTSCSRPIGPGQQFGDFEVVEAFSRDGGRICPPGEDDCDDLCDAGKPAVLTMLLTGDDCSATSHSQDPGKVSCTDFGALAGDLRVVATDKENPDDNKAKTWFDGTVSVGGSFDIAAAAGGDSKLKANTWVHIYSADGTTLLQSVLFHTSCSQPLELGDQFGALQLTGFTPEA